MATMEIEFKFCIPADRLKAVEAALRRGTVVRTRLQARYFDTADQQLAAHGMVLRLRKEGRRWVQTVKATGDNALHRLEHNVDLGAASATPDIDPQRHQGTPVGDRLTQLLADGGAPLVERQSTDIVRLTRDVRVSGPGGAIVEMALDVGKVVAHAGTPEQRESPVCELELELKRGDVQGLVSLSRRWSQQHGLWFSTVSKAERGARLLAAQDIVPAVKAEAPRFATQHPDGRAIQQAVVASCLAQMLPNASEIAAGSTDEEQIHQLRIGIRRLRTALRELAGLDVASGLFDAGEWEPPLVDAFRALGALRDREQVVKLAQPQLRDAGAPDFDPLAGDDTAARGPSPGDAVRAPAFQSVLVSLIGFTAAGSAEAAPTHNAEEAPETPSVPAPMSADDAYRLLRKRLQHLHKQAVRDGARFESLDTESQHRVRKRLKRLRYLAEFIAPLFDAEGKSSSAAERYLKHLRPAQDALGEFNDEAVALALYREAAARDGRAWFAVGWFSARHAVHAKTCRKALGGIEEAPRFWKKGD
ncbi:CYTH and CHAD domain-containing protein [Variovorax sp. PAMC26660]|uniref:CYTH and CHAD domain-containing protein n=1 Tax=Variovorax sp. PAMC26660 TaxID=2762322 RepID=UPI00164E423B|nr:CYTH and CHAD domain-containing protein [Variovorax sp. PAMC26660]QNK70229.1 CYTH and CHAD domain-containing protein [Variovorax sp. PAMC26660]